jgi:hypothetical protein
MTDNYDSYAATAKELLKRVDLRWLPWRKHELGMLQGELNEEIRIHLFHPALVTIPTEGLRNVHDHRFDLTSYVAYGSIVDVPHAILFDPKHPSPEGVTLTDCWEIAHAKVQTEETRGVHLGRVKVRPLDPITRGKGAVYTIPRRQFHTTRVIEFAITVVYRSNFDDKPARILGTKDNVVGMCGMNHNPDPDVVHSIVDMAIKARETL